MTFAGKLLQYYITIRITKQSLQRKVFVYKNEGEEKENETVSVIESMRNRQGVKHRKREIERDIDREIEIEKRQRGYKQKERDVVKATEKVCERE